MFLHVERFQPGTNPDCAEECHLGTIQPALADLLVDGRPLCYRHFRALIPIVELVS